jgi:hypothetical protein
MRLRPFLKGHKLLAIKLSDNNRKLHGRPSEWKKLPDPNLEV